MSQPSDETKKWQGKFDDLQNMLEVSNDNGLFVDHKNKNKANEKPGGEQVGEINEVPGSKPDEMSVKEADEDAAYRKILDLIIEGLSNLSAKPQVSQGIEATIITGAPATGSPRTAAYAAPTGTPPQTPAQSTPSITTTTSATTQASPSQTTSQSTPTTTTQTQTTPTGTVRTAPPNLTQTNTAVTMQPVPTSPTQPTPPKPTPPNILEARKKYSLARHEFNKYIANSPPHWRTVNYYALPAVLYLVILFFGTLVLWGLEWRKLVNVQILWIPSYAFLWGAVGAMLYGFWWLWQNVKDRAFRKVWYIWYFLLPIMGSIFGAIAYMIFVAGLISTTGGTANIQSLYFIIFLSTLAGFSAKWMVQVIDNVKNVIKFQEKS